MEQISVILKNNILITIEEFRILDRNASSGRVWTLIERPAWPYGRITCKVPEYIFDAEALTLFLIVSRNILVQWDTCMTAHLCLNEEFQIKDSLFITPCNH